MYRKDKEYSKGAILNTLLLALLLFTYSNTYSQVGKGQGELSSASLPNCIEYAIQHNPDIRNAMINEDITEATIKSKLADWYPQVNFNYSLQHNFQLPTVNFNGNITHSGTRNVSGADFGFTQNIFNRDALLATRSSKEVRLSANQNTRLQKIDL
ncbi:MAG: TolC family protein, partial [Bacteroidetes bacterium]|nr:TolC family protein [Bacteroidota bacterium]